MNKQTITLTDEKLQNIYTDEQFRNQVANAHKCLTSNSVFKHMQTCSYPITYIVTEEQIALAKSEKLRGKMKALESIGNKLVFVGMGMTYDIKPNEELEMYDDIGNHRIRTEFVNDKGNQYFLEFSKSARRPTEAHIDFAIDRTKQIQLNDSYHRQGEFYNYKGLERNLTGVFYSKHSIINLVNRHFDCSFSVMEIDNYNLSPDDFICVSPKGISTSLSPLTEIARRALRGF